jgi:hypothetical protein
MPVLGTTAGADSDPAVLTPPEAPAVAAHQQRQ